MTYNIRPTFDLCICGLSRVLVTVAIPEVLWICLSMKLARDPRQQHQQTATQAPR